MAEIEKYPPGTVMPAQGGCPSLAVRCLVVLDCRCGVLVGSRIDTSPPEAATVAYACGPEHREIPKLFNEGLDRSLENPSDLPLEEAVALILEKAETDFHASAR